MRGSRSSVPIHSSKDMFTGLIEAVGKVAELKSATGGFRVRLRTELASAVSPGDSLAVNGVCLTVIAADRGEVHADIGPETARVTTLGSLRHEQRVNLERPMRADGLVGGHFVQGHVDGTGIVEQIRPDGDSHWLSVSFDRSLSPYLIRKGSIAVDGISLTVATLGGSTFDVMIIPFTWSHTALSSLTVRDLVNIECDMIGKYVARSLELLEGVGRLKPARQTMSKNIRIAKGARKRSPFASIEEAVAAIRDGQTIIVCDDEDRENEGDLTIAAEKVTPAVINFMAKHGRGQICLSMTGDRLDELEIPLAVNSNTTAFGTAFCVPIDVKRGGTGISASDRAATVLAAIDPATKPSDLARPGHMSPLRSRDGGVMVRAGQTEAAVDLARMAGLQPAGVICEIMN